MSEPSYSDKLRSLPFQVPSIRLLYLFGSRASGAVGPLSDYDLAVLVDEEEASAEELLPHLAHELTVRLGAARLDLILLNQAPIELAYAIIAQGHLLYQRDVATRVEYEADVLSRYGDYLPVLRAQRRAILEGGDHAARVQRYRAALGRTERTLGEVGAPSRQATG
jgi:predicted nucleotidyltransferase